MTGPYHQTSASLPVRAAGYALVLGVRDAGAEWSMGIFRRSDAVVDHPEAKPQAYKERRPVERSCNPAGRHCRSCWRPLGVRRHIDGHGKSFAQTVLRIVQQPRLRQSELCRTRRRHAGSDHPLVVPELHAARMGVAAGPLTSSHFTVANQSLDRSKAGRRVYDDSLIGLT